MKLIYLLPIALLFSCKSTKFKDIEADYTQGLKGNIAQMVIKNITYHNKTADLNANTVTSTQFFKAKNIIVKQVDEFPNFTDETVFSYDGKGRLETQVSTVGERIRTVKYRYDGSDNLLEYKEDENGKIIFVKTFVYDRRNNPIKVMYKHPHRTSASDVDIYKYDYKDRTAAIQSFSENSEPGPDYLKVWYDKNGNIIKTQTIGNEKRDGYSTCEYDNRGNLFQRKSFKIDGEQEGSTTYKNSYDQKGNIIIREKYSGDKLVEKFLFQIEYR